MRRGSSLDAAGAAHPARGILTLSGSHHRPGTGAADRHPSFGLVLGVTLILAVSLWATARFVRGAATERVAPGC